MNNKNQVNKQTKNQYPQMKNLKRMNKHQKQNQICQEFWNYQIRYLFFKKKL